MRGDGHSERGGDAAEGDVFLFIFRDFFFAFPLWMCVCVRTIAKKKKKKILSDWEIVFCFEENNTLSFALEE